MDQQNKKRILVTVLNWGLGHATRCLPIIRQLQQQGHNVFLASDGRALALLKKECPELTCLTLPAHNIKYGKKRFMWLMAWQLPKIAVVTIIEHLHVRKMVRQLQIDTIISDNRFGCFHRQCHSIFMTHQLNIIVDHLWIERVVQWINKTWIRIFFQICWVPDLAGVPNLSGQLSHGGHMPTIKYIGLLSRMQQLSVGKEYAWIAVLSGPEPQRTLLENIIIEQAKMHPMNAPALIVGGKSERSEQYNINKHLTYRSFVAGAELNRLMCASHVIICRSGYSTLMDLAAIGGRAILIPTPQQSEQEYLAAHLFEQGLFYTQSQQDFNLQNALVAAESYAGFESIWREIEVQNGQVIHL
jgi:predicted glycosyltransferase